MRASRARLAGAAVGLGFGCTSPPPPPGLFVMGTFNLTGALSSSTCPFDASASGKLLDIRVDGGLQQDGGGLSPASLDVTWTLSLSPGGHLYLSSGQTQREGTLTGGSFLIENAALRAVCGNAWLVEQLSGTFYGPPQLPGPDGGCLVLSGPGTYLDGGLWPFPDGGALTDGGAPQSTCFTPRGLLNGALLVDDFAVLPDGGADGGNLCSPDGGVVAECETTYAMGGAITP